MFLKQLFSLFLGITLLTACSKKDNRDIDQAVSAFIHGNDKVVSFGSVEFQTILDKADYKKIPKVGKLIEERLGNVLNTKSPVYYVLEGPFDKNGNPTSTYAFFDLTNQDSLVKLLGSSGLYLETAGDMKYNLNNDVSIGTVGNLAVLITKKEEYDGKALLENAFKKMQGDVAGGKTDQLLKQKHDVSMNINLENLYGTSNTELSSLNETRQKEVVAMMDDSYMHADLNFEKGRMILRTENLFSDALQKRMFLKEDGNANVISKLGKGNASLGAAANLDMQKVENFVDDFMPQIKNKLFNERPETALAAIILGDNPLTKVLNGIAGLVVVGDPRMTGFTPEVNFNLGLGKEGKPYISAAASEMLKRFTYTITDTDLIASSPNAGAGQTSLTIPSCGKDFGKEGITAFVNLENMDMQSFGLPMKYKWVNLIKNVTFKMNNKRGELIVNTLNSDTNILKQAVDLYLKDLENMIGKVSV